MNPPSLPATGPAFDAWDVIDQWIDELTRLAREPMSSPAFQGELLRRLSEAVAAKRAAVWQPTPEWSVVKATTDDSPQAATAGSLPFGVERARVVAQVAERGEPCLLLPRAPADDDDGLGNPTDGVLLICPWLVDGAPRGALEVELRAATSPETRQGALRLLTTFAQLAADHEINRERLSWKERAEAGDELEAVVTAIYADVDPQAVAYALANEGRRWVGCDRVSVLRFDGKRARVAAVSGVDAVDRRADGVAKLERLGTEVAAARADLCSVDPSESRVPSVERALADYVEAAESREIAMLLLREPRGVSETTESEQSAADRRDDPPRIVGLLVFERFAGAPLDVAARARFEILRRHGSAAISHAADLESIPLGRFWRRFAKHRTERRRRWTKIGLGLAALFGVAAIPFFITVPYTVEARGTLEPRERWDLFAPASGIVAEVQAEHGRQVKQGAVLVRLRKPELEVEQVRLLGEIQTTDRRLAALATNRATPVAGDAAALRSQQLLVAEEEQLKVRVESLRAELTRLDEQVRELTVVAPADGSVTTWDAERLLSDKPVDRGHPLVSLADLDRPWVLELRVPDRRLADIAAARHEFGKQLEVDFIVAADPQTEFVGTLERLADAAQTDARHGTTVAAVVRIGDGLTRDEVIRAELRKPGASVIAKIHCGTRSLGHIWTEDFIYYLRTRWFF